MGWLKKIDWEKAIDKIADQMGDGAGVAFGDFFSGEDLKIVASNVDLFVEMPKDLIQVIFMKLNSRKFDDAITAIVETYDADLVIKAMRGNIEETQLAIDEYARRSKFLKSVGKGTLYALLQVLYHLVLMG